MRTHLAHALCALTLTLAAPAMAAQPPRTGETLDYINARMEHSAILRVDDEGVVKVRTPSGILTFNLKESAFNCNFQNNDDRVRIASGEPIELWNGSHRDEVKYRQSFSCRTSTDARETVQALRRLKAGFLGQEGHGALFNRRLAITEKDLPYATLGEAMDFVNDTLQVSVLLKVDPKGILTIQGPDAFYHVDLTRAEFGLNGRDGNPRVRVYGDWCIDLYRDGRKDQAAARESFSTRSRHGARDVVKALYYLKGAFTGLTSENINALRSVTGARTHEYATIAQAVDAINDRLEVSIILGVDPKGAVTVNASDSTFKFNIQDCSFDRPREEKHLLGLVRFRREDGVNITAPKGLKKFEDGRFYDTVDDQTFSCHSDKDIPFVIRALEFIRSEARKGSAN